MNLQIVKLLAGAAFVVSGYSASAQDRNSIGSVGLTFGGNYISDVQTRGDKDTATVGSVELSGDIAFPVGNNYMIGIDGKYRFDDLSSTQDFDNDEDPETQYSFTIHALKNFSDTTRAGIFLNYGRQSSQNETRWEDFDYAMIGVEGQTMISDDFLLYGQVGLGDKVRDGEDDEEGFNNGMTIRTGFNYFVSERTALNMDFEFAGSNYFIDGRDPGRYYGFSFGAETRLKPNAPLMINYGISYTNIHSIGEGQGIEEFGANIGIKYVLGANTPLERWTNGIAIGAPRLPVRASAWTEFID